MSEDKMWRDKDIRIARQSAIKDAVNLLDVAERMGLLNKKVKTFDDLLDINEYIADLLFKKIYEGM